jgi:hypothetical protein
LLRSSRLAAKWIPHGGQVWCRHKLYRNSGEG